MGLSKSMVLIKSSNKDGTFAAREDALKKGLPLFVAYYYNPERSTETNPYIIEKGGHPIRKKNGALNLGQLLEVIYRKQIISGKDRQMTLL